MPPLPLLGPKYQACPFEYQQVVAPGLPSMHDWISVFRAANPTFAKHALTDETLPLQARQAAADKFSHAFLDILAELDADPHAAIHRHDAQPLSCVLLCQYREQCLKDAGFKDIFKAVKDKENAQALQHLAAVLGELDAQHDAADRWTLALQGVFAGNIFDLGAATSALLYAQNGAASSFTDTRKALVPRPWVYDSLDAILQSVCGSSGNGSGNGSGYGNGSGHGHGNGSGAQASAQAITGAVPNEAEQSDPSATGASDATSSGMKMKYSKVLMFVDNAGSDVVLGMLPLAREFIKAGCQVVMAANEGPSCNDITAAELRQVLGQAAQLDAIIGEAVIRGQLRVVSSGNWLPVIDLSNVSEELCSECESVDLVILEGMGRAIETNLHAMFTCDSWKLGMIKHEPVARGLRGRLYDCVCKFDAASSLTPVAAGVQAGLVSKC